MRSFYSNGAFADNRCKGTDGGQHWCKYGAYQSNIYRETHKFSSALVMDGDLVDISFFKKFLYLFEQVFTIDFERFFGCACHDQFPRSAAQAWGRQPSSRVKYGGVWPFPEWFATSDVAELRVQARRARADHAVSTAAATRSVSIRGG